MATIFISRLGAGLALALIALATAPAQAQPRPLTLAFIPQENPEKLVGDIRAIGAYLEAELKRPVRGFVTQDHAAAIEALAQGAADISFMGALPYVLARARIGAEVILAEIYRGKASYSGALFVRSDAKIGAPADLRGKTIAFADPVSESGYMYPLEIFVVAGLMKRGDDPQGFFRRVYFAGGYQQAIQAVANGLVDAAGVSIYARLLLPPEQQHQVRILAESAPIPSHAVIARKELGPGEREAFIAAMLKLNEPAQRHLLKHVYTPDGYARTSHADYAGVEAMARNYGLIR